ncbi:MULTISPECIES: AIPR family protein [Providencia]|uniref:AIPR family protein n=1 Tax=Providencia TaxID=586 RepID=UPI0019822B2E|nr:MULTISPECIES: AIPR family protein [Providencia]MBN4866606.1 AIPR family protein [Providencia stuartii]MBN4876122.1 AIPR family protein [Providencia stuartii]MBN4880620.1 AIPR family protein [Providencia stuartii]MBN4885322.1 AIPR family protein [Providencia stuartii]
MNPIIKAQLDKFREANPNITYNESNFFEVMSIFSIENGVLGENIDPFRAHLKGDEFGIDGIAISIQGTLCTDIDEAEAILSVGKNHTSEFRFYQSKTSDSLDYGNISKFLDAVYDFFTDKKFVTGTQLENLIEVKEEIYKESAKTSPSLRCYYCTTGSGNISTLIQQLIDTNKARLADLNIFDEIHIQCVGAKIIQNGFRAATNSSSAKLNFPKAITMPSHDKVDEAYIGYVPASEILEIALGEADQDGERHINRSLFYDNVRDFNPNSEINKTIISELESGDNSSFVFKNNGITVVSKSIDRKSDTFTIEDYQIVNGCQTTNILAHIKDKIDGISVPLRLIGCSDIDFISSVIIGTNRQNEVKEDQFWAMRPFMKDLEEYCASQTGDGKIFIERRDSQYRDISIERTRIFKPSDLMKAAAAMFFHQPHRAARDHRGIRNEFANRIFTEGHNVELYYVAALALYKFDFLVRTAKIERSRAIFKFYTLYALFRKHWKTPDILDAPPKSQKKVKDAVASVLNDNEMFLNHVEDVAVQLEQIISDAGMTNREKIRDYIRTESVVTAFSNKLFP